MDTRGLIDAVVREMAVLIAELATVSGVRAPLGHVQDVLFLALAEELERRDVGRKVAADMFGLGLRAYQKKLRRLEESQSVRGRSLWEAVAEFVAARERVTRGEVLHRFRRDDEQSVAAILADLVASGLVERHGRGDAAQYESLEQAGDERHARELLAVQIWASLDRQPAGREDLAARFQSDGEVVDETVARLLEEERLIDDAGTLRAVEFVVPVGATHGFEAAVLDHVRAMRKAIIGKLQMPDSTTGGGTTLSFDLHDEHPHRERVIGLLSQIRTTVNEVWEQVHAHNAEHAPRGARQKLYFYLGQAIEALSDE